MRRVILLAFLLCSISFAEEKKPNILFIMIDDLNDWVGCLKGHEQALTPNIDKLAARGTLFKNAHCQAPVCQPSRSSMMSSRYPSSTGLYFLNPGVKDSPVTKNELTIPERFKKEGYKVMSIGKLFHHRDNMRILPKVGEYGGSNGGFGPLPKKRMNYFKTTRLWDWGAFPESDSQMPDVKITKWAVEKIKQKHDKPFFMAVGFYRPHVPLFVPEKWFKKFPLESVKLPPVVKNDLSDLSKYAISLTNLNHIAPLHSWVLDNKQWGKLVQSYLASIYFVDDCVGKVLTALENSPHKDNTIIILASDHGFHMGEKERWAKRSLWEDSTRVPVIFAGKGIKKGISSKPIGLIDLYPTMLTLSGLKADPKHEGLSIIPLLNDPNAKWDRPIRTTFGKGNHSIRSERWRYIRYFDGSEELYDHTKDPHEWNNLINKKELADIVEAHKKWLPKNEKDVMGKNSTGHKAYEATHEKLLKK